jgi:hypothetical protein
VATSAGVETELGKEKGGDDVSWDDMNLTGPKKKFTRSIQLLQMNDEYLKQ